LFWFSGVPFFVPGFLVCFHLTFVFRICFRLARPFSLQMFAHSTCQCVVFFFKNGEICCFELFVQDRCLSNFKCLQINVFANFEGAVTYWWS